MNKFYSGRPEHMWLIIVFLILLFFIANHDLYYPQKYIYMQSGSAEGLISDIASGSITRRFALFSLFCFSIGSLLLRAHPRLGCDNKLIIFTMAFIFWSVSSILWADNTLLCVRRVTAFLFMCFGAYIIAKQLTFPDLIRLSFIGSFSYLIIGIICEIMLGTFAPFHNEYRFSGTIHPNHQGWNCALLILSSLYLAKIEGRKQYVLYFCMLIGFFFLILTKSRTSFFCVIFAMLPYLYFNWSNRRKLTITYLVIICGCFFFLLGLNSLFPELEKAILLGRGGTTSSDFYSDTSTLTGRLPIWEVSMGYVAKRPFLGYGFNSFWDKEHIIKITSELKLLFPAAHCDYIETLLGVGIVGLSLFIIILWLALYGYSRALFYDYNLTNSFGFSLLIFGTSAMIAEVIGFSTSFPTFILYVAILKAPFLPYWSKKN
jgi:exopolysaccharide production protein ExoQ